MPGSAGAELDSPFGANLLFVNLQILSLRAKYVFP